MVRSLANIFMLRTKALVRKIISIEGPGFNENVRYLTNLEMLRNTYILFLILSLLKNKHYG